MQYLRAEHTTIFIKSAYQLQWLVAILSLLKNMCINDPKPVYEGRRAARRGAAGGACDPITTLHLVEDCTMRGVAY